MPNQTITVQFTVQNEDDFFASIEEGMISDQGGYSSYTVLDIANDEYNRQSKSELSVAYNRLLAEKSNECLFLDDLNPAKAATIISSDRLSSDTVLFIDQLEFPSEEVIVAAKEIVDRIVINCEQKIRNLHQKSGVNSSSHPWRLLYGEFLENEIHSESPNNLGEMLFEIEGSHTPYCVMEFIEGAGWECYQDFMGGEEIYYSSLFDQPE
jgi:hypothetical protein